MGCSTSESSGALRYMLFIIVVFTSTIVNSMNVNFIPWRC